VGLRRNVDRYFRTMRATGEGVEIALVAALLVAMSQRAVAWGMADDERLGRDPQ
jgi:hypothetical protein